MLYGDSLTPIATLTIQILQLHIINYFSISFLLYVLNYNAIKLKSSKISHLFSGMPSSNSTGVLALVSSGLEE